MGARHRLNSIYFLTALCLAALLGGMTQSWIIFVVSGIALTASMIYGGDIRPQPLRKWRRRR